MYFEHRIPPSFNLHNTLLDTSWMDRGLQTPIYGIIQQCVELLKQYTSEDEYEKGNIRHSIWRLELWLADFRPQLDPRTTELQYPSLNDLLQKRTELLLPFILHVTNIAQFVLAGESPLKNGRNWLLLQERSLRLIHRF